MTLRCALKCALRAAEDTGNDLRAATLRLALCAVRDRDMKARRKDDSRGCEDREITDILHALVDQRESAAKEHDAAGRIDLAEKEREQVSVLQEFLPRCLDPDQMTAAAEQVVQELGARGLKDMGRCVSELKARYPDRIDSGAAKAAVKKLLI